MADNNILNRPFGLNISLPERTIQQVKESFEKRVNIFAPVQEYMEKSDAVFSGSVQEQIDKYNNYSSMISSIMNVGNSTPMLNLTI